MNGMFGMSCHFGFSVSNKNDVFYCGVKGKVCKYATLYGQCAMSACMNHENEKTISGFAEYLKAYAKQVKENGYDGIGEIDIDDKLREYLE